VICAPSTQLRWVQRQILRKILDKVSVHSAAHGFVTGRSTVTNATIHQEAEIILKFDLQDFFPTIHANRVIGLFARLGYFLGNGRFNTSDYSENVAATLARLWTYSNAPKRFGFGHAPQGAPTSPAISNIICRGLDARLEGLAHSCNGNYTRYADDLTFSFASAELNVGRFRWWVDQICHQEGFIVNQPKFRAIRRSQRQSITGIVVNDGLRVPRPQRRRFRAMLHNCRKHGIESQAGGNPAFASYLRGFASYLYMVHPEEGKQAMAELDEIFGREE
jgi:RNA-directed DNA polymerase